MAGSFYLGTSGFAYEPWRGPFYPKGLPMSRMLGHYATVFRSVEINYTFRHMPSRQAIAGWRDQTPERFRFTLKAHRRITHMRELRGAATALPEFAREARGLGIRMGPILYQIPPGLAYGPELFARFADLLPQDIPAVMELRDPSWRESWPHLAERGIARCVADTDEEPAGDDDLVWLPFGYLRLRRASYDDAELGTWAERIAAALTGGHDVYCYLKHEDSAAGPRMAQRLDELVAAAMPATAGT